MIRGLSLPSTELAGLTVSSLAADGRPGWRVYDRAAP